MEDEKKKQLRRKQLEQRLEQLRKEVGSLADEERMIHYYDVDSESKERIVREKIRKIYEEIYLVQDELCLLVKEKVASNEVLDVYLADGVIEKGYGNFDIFLHGTSTRIGHVRLNRETDDVFGNVGYGLQEEYRGHRFMLQSLELLKDTMKKMKIVKPIITVEPENIPSVKTIQNFGGVLIKNHEEYDTYYDTYEVDLCDEETSKKR